jgi:xylulokinase
VPVGLLPEIVDGTSIVGPLTDKAAGDLGLPAGLPIVAGSGDVCATAIGSGATADGELHIHLGTSTWIGGFFPDRRLSVTEAYATIAGAVGHRPLLIASQETSGACFDWIHAILNDNGGTTINALIESSASDGLPPPLFLPWMTGERVPADESRLRGAFVGLSLDHGRASLVNAVLQGVALNTRWAFSSVKRQPGVLADRPTTVVGGAALSKAWFRVLADCLQTPLKFVDDPHLAGVRGAAIIAAAGLGHIASPWETGVAVSAVTGTVVEPDSPRAEYYDDRYAEFQAVYRRLRPWFRKVIGARLSEENRHRDGS